MRLSGLLACLLLPLLLVACDGVEARKDSAISLLEPQGWSEAIIEAGPFQLFAAWMPRGAARVLTVYIEGDGFAYLDETHPSSDPTPRDAMGLRLALADKEARMVAYLGRPCQFVMPAHGQGCTAEYWTSKRYAPEVVDSISAAIDQLKVRTDAQKVLLVGYSGGGAVAALVAGRRKDVVGLATVVANLDLGYWLSRDGLLPLDGSLDPALEAGRLANLPQVHFAGGKDEVVGPDVVQSYLSRLPPSAPARLEILADQDHYCCWAEIWPSLINRFRANP